MSVFSNLSIITAIISFCGLIIAVLKLLDEQRKYHKLKYSQEKRLEYKLRIYEILIDSILPIDQIITKHGGFPFS